MSFAPSVTTVLRRNNVRQSGLPDGRPIVFAHGYGCSQDMWRLVTPHFEQSHRVITFDHVGSGESDLDAYDRGTYDSLHGYSDDLLQIMTCLDLDDAIVVGHSVGAIIAMIAETTAPDRFGGLVLVNPSPSYVNDGDYLGGFERSDIDDMLVSLEANYVRWAAAMAPVLMGNSDQPSLSEELSTSFCRVDPTVARHFARVTFLSDHRDELTEVSTPTVILQSSEDVIAPVAVGEYMRSQVAGSHLVVVEANGHCLHLSHPAEVVAAIQSFLES